jgi:zinc D-Ala-D-Ala carboxypeptidase
MGDLSANFSSSEFSCPCCGQSNMDSDFIEKLQKLRDVLGVSIGIVEGGGFRCSNYLKGAKSAHGEGKAADLNVSRAYYYDIVGMAKELGFTGIGIKNKDGRFQIHLDSAGEIPGVRPRPWIWTY